MDDRVDHPATGVAVDSFILQGMATGQDWSRLVQVGCLSCLSSLSSLSWLACSTEAPSVLAGTVQFGSVRCSAVHRRLVFWLHRSWLLSAHVSLSLSLSLSLPPRLHSASVLLCETRCVTTPLSGSSAEIALTPRSRFRPEYITWPWPLRAWPSGRSAWLPKA
jgi:hypothetical protein